MTISSTNRKAGPFTGNGVTTAFPFTFKVFTAADLLVVQAVTATGIESAKTLGADYTVSLNADQNANPGGTIAVLIAPPAGQTLTATSQAQNLQPTDLTNQGGFYPRVINDALDRLTIFVQQLALKLSRALVFPLSDGGGGNPTLPAKDQRQGTVLAFHETTGDPVAGPRITAVNTVVGAVAAIQTVADDLDGANTIGLVAANMPAVQAAGPGALLVQDAIRLFAEYLDFIVRPITFPLDLGLITEAVTSVPYEFGLVADLTILNSYDIGAI